MSYGKDLELEMDIEKNIVNTVVLEIKLFENE